MTELTYGVEIRDVPAAWTLYRLHDGRVGISRERLAEGRAGHFRQELATGAYRLDVKRRGAVIFRVDAEAQVVEFAIPGVGVQRGR